MQTFQLVRQTRLNINVEQAWDFFSNPHNLRLLTPEALSFSIVSHNIPDKIYNDLIIKYKVKPLLGIPVMWESQILEVNEYQSFRDIQLKGPYAYWNHLHTFKSEPDNSTLMEDRIEYALPLGKLGTWLMLNTVQNKLDSIFEFRRTFMQERFGG